MHVIYLALYRECSTNVLINGLDTNLVEADKQTQTVTKQEPILSGSVIGMVT